MTIQHYTSIPFEVFTIDNLFTEEELTEFQIFILNTPLYGRTFTNSEFVNGKIIHENYSKNIYSKLKHLLPFEYCDNSSVSWSYAGSTKVIMFANIQPNQQFGIHTDTGYEYDKINNLYSKYTLLIYLNDDYEGGTTTFYTDTFIERFKVQPKKGRILCFDIDLFHSGDRVSNGNKMWIGTELVCKKIFN
jgi:hypothetical protein